MTIRKKTRIIGFETASDSIKYAESRKIKKASYGYNKKYKFFIEY